MRYQGRIWRSQRSKGQKILATSFTSFPEMDAEVSAETEPGDANTECERNDDDMEADGREDEDEDECGGAPRRRRRNRKAAAPQDGISPFEDLAEEWAGASWKKVEWLSGHESPHMGWAHRATRARVARQMRRRGVGRAGY